MSRILFASSHMYFPDRSGGLESSTHELVLALQKATHYASVLCVAPLVEATNDETGSVPQASLDRSLGYDVFRAARPAQALADVVSSQNIDTVVIHPSGGMRLIAAAQSTPVTTIIYIRDVEFSSEFWSLRHLRNAKFIANSKFTAQRAATQYGLECSVIHPLVKRERYQVSPSRERILFVNPVPEKGIEIVLKLAAARADVQFDIVESWPLHAQYRVDYRQRAEQLANVVWLSRQQDMRELYSTAKIVLVPSLWEEGWGRVVTEGQFSGIPALASNRGGLPESVGPGGILVDHPSDISSWKAKLDLMVDDVECYARLSDLAAEHSRRIEISEQYTVDRFLDVLVLQK